MEADSAGFDPIYDKEENVEQAAMVESDGPQEMSAQDYSDQGCSQDFLRGFPKTVLIYQSRGLGVQILAAEKLSIYTVT